MLEIEAVVEELPEGISFSRLFSRALYRVEVVVTFLAILELIKIKKIKVTQNGLYSDIFICREG
jgi:segregation and condensation protein A